MPAHVHAQNISANSGGPALRCDYASDVNGFIYPQGINTGETGGGIKRTTTCHPTRLASSGIAQRSCAEREQRKSKRGGVCLTSLTF